MRLSKSITPSQHDLMAPTLPFVICVQTIKEWFWYQSQESLVDVQSKISGEGIAEKLEQRLTKITPNLGEDTQTERGRMFEQFADLFDDDAALAAM